MTKGTIAFSDTDYAIVAALRRNGRATNQQIAAELSLTATTVSTRIHRMEDANQLRVVAVSDFSALGYTVLMRIAVEVDGRAASEVAADLARFAEVFACHMVTGRYDLDVLVALRDLSGLSEFTDRVVAEVDGIRTLIPSIILDVVKYEFDVAPIEGHAR